MASDDDLAAFSNAELVQGFVEAIQLHDTLQHIGRKNRLVDRRFRILAELKSRNGTLEPLRCLLDHSDPSVQLSAALAFRTIDRPACERMLGNLAARDDKIAREAQQCMRYLLKAVEVEPELKLETRKKKSPFDWQVDNPPPVMMSLAEIKRLLNEEFPADLAARLLRLAEPAVGLWPQRPRPDLPATASRLGGMPHAPPGWVWPHCEEEPMLFLGQINCAELRGVPAATSLPPFGLLIFFGDHDAVMSGTQHGGKPIAVFHWTEIDRLGPASPPLKPQIVFPLCELAFYPLIDMPDPCSRAIQSTLTKQDQDWSYWDVWDAVREHGIPEEYSGYCAFSRLFGWPRWEQGEIGNIGDQSGPNGLRLLLQLDSYSNGTESAEWGDHGALYFLMRDGDLRTHRWDRCEFEMQCG